MVCANSPCSPVPEVACSAGTFSDGSPAATSSGMTTASACLPPESVTESSLPPPSSAISEHSLIKGTPSDIEAWLTSSQPGFHARPFPSPGNEPELTIPATCGPQPLTSFAWLDPDTRSWKTCQASLPLATSEPSFEDWPKAGIESRGACWELATLALPIEESDCGSPQWPTPRTTGMDGGSHSREAAQRRGRWPTATARDWKSGHASEATMARNARPLSEQVVNREKWPSPTASCGTGAGHSGRQGGLNLQTAVKWPTPRASDRLNTVPSGMRQR